MPKVTRRRGERRPHATCNEHGSLETDGTGWRVW